jgi:hypothetical protein
MTTLPQYVVSGTVQSVPDDRDYPYPVGNVTSFVDRVSLRRHDLPIEDQAQEGSCTTNAGATILEGKLLARGQFRHLSRQQPYYDARILGGTLGQEGAQPRNVCRVYKNIGVCDEIMWPYNPANENMQPSPDAYAQAASQKIGRYEVIPLPDPSTIEGIEERIRNIKSALMQGDKVYVAFKVYEWFRHLKGDEWEQQLLDTSVPGYLEPIGNHEVVIDKFDDNVNMGIFGIQNSWSINWGDRGYGALSYAWVADIFEARVMHDFIEPDQPLSTPTILPYPQNAIMVAGLYAALFGHAAEASGLNFWIGKLAGGMSPQELAQQMYQTDPGQLYYPGYLTNTEIVRKIYANVLGRQIDTDSLYYWTKVLNQAEIVGEPPQVGVLIIELLNIVLNYKGNDFEGSAATNLFRNKILVSLYCGQTLNCDILSIAQHALDGITYELPTAVAACARLRVAMGL